LQPGMVAGYQAMQEMIDGKALPSSILVLNDFAAVGVMERLKIAGLSIPGDISLVGYDDLGNTGVPPLTTVRVDLHQVGKLATEALFRMLNNEQVDNEYVVPVDLIVRGSTAMARMDKENQ